MGTCSLDSAPTPTPQTLGWDKVHLAYPWGLPAFPAMESAVSSFQIVLSPGGLCPNVPPLSEVPIPAWHYLPTALLFFKALSPSSLLSPLPL